MHPCVLYDHRSSSSEAGPYLKLCINVEISEGAPLKVKGSSGTSYYDVFLRFS